MHERAWKAMRNLAKALWQSDSSPEIMEELVNLRERDAALNYGRHQHVEKLHENPRPW